MSYNQNDIKIIKDLLKKMEIDPQAKYLSAREIEVVYGIPAKTVLNRSNLKSTHPRFIPSLRLRGGRKKLFETKVFERMIQQGGVK